MYVNYLVGNAVPLSSSKHCNFAGDECWRVRTHPTIVDISSNTGWSSGLQTLTVYGYGFLQAVFLEYHDEADRKIYTNVVVTIDGQSCEVFDVGRTPHTVDGVDFTHSMEYFLCVTSTDGGSHLSAAEHDQPGQPGINYNKYKQADNADNPVWDPIIQDGVAISSSLYTSFETIPNVQANKYNPDGISERFSQTLTGWFVPPADGNYRFLMSCDDNCKLFLDDVNTYASGNPADITVVANLRAWNYSAKEHRNYMHDFAGGLDAGVNQPVSDWIALLAG